MFSFFKKIDQQPPAEIPAHAELGDTEQKTPKAGYMLLIAMVVVSLFFGWRAIDDLQDVPQKPEILSYCAGQFLPYEWEDAGRYQDTRYAQPEYVYEPGYPVKPKIADCSFAGIEAKYGIPAVYEQKKGLDLQLQNIQLELEKVTNSILDYERQYNLGLQEKIAEEQRKLYPIDVIQRNLQPLRKQKSDLEIQIDSVRANLKRIEGELKDIYVKLLPEYRAEWRWYELQVFGLEALFVFPFFWIVFRIYRRLLYKKSPYTIIFTALLGVASLLLIRIFIVWFWNLFLARIVQTLWNYIQNFALLKSIFFYSGMGLSIVIFGGAVYLLQKHIFDPKRTALRALKRNTCPQCEFSLDIAAEYCPNCGRRIKEKCPSCGNMRFVDFPSCPHCGNKGY